MRFTTNVMPVYLNYGLTPYSRGEPKGKVTKIDGNIDAYLATPPADKAREGKGILFLPDVIGIWQNSKLLADNFAAQGYTVLMPDIFNGDALSLNRPGDFDFGAWMTKGSTGDNPHTPEAVDPIVLKGIKALRDLGIKRIGAIGYCFGAKVSEPLLTSSKESIMLIRVRSTSSATTRTVSTLATWLIPRWWRRTSSPPSPALCPSPPPRRTPSSRRRNATSQRRF